MKILQINKFIAISIQLKFLILIIRIIKILWDIL